MGRDSDPVLQKSFLAARECHQRGDLAGAEAIYSRLLALDPADHEVLFLFGHLQAGKGNLETGLECLNLARQLNPANPQIPYSIGVLLQEAGRLPAAAEAYRHALETSPAMLPAWENLCTACYDMDQFASGLAAAEAARRIQPASLLAIRGAANCLAGMGRRAEALAVLEEGIRHHPAHPELRIHRAWELIANGRYEEGWREFEWRHSRMGASDAPPRSIPYPGWNGEALDGKSILVYGEQGVGDEIMFAPYVRDILRSGGRCILECEPRLERLFARAFPECIILPRTDRGQIAWQADLPRVDFCIASQSLPLHFWTPLTRPAFLSADPQRVAYWRKRLQGLGSGPKVGVSWRGGADAKARRIRSIPPALFGEMTGAGDPVFVSLQYGAAAQEAAAVSPALKHFPEIDPLSDLDEFSALVAAMDMVVSVDNSTVHLACALGVKTLLLLPVYAEWRWGNAASGASSWYASLETLRQPVASEAGWREVVASARRRIEACNPSPNEPRILSAQAGTATLLHPAPPGHSALLVGDTHHWYHWGCACTSLGLHEGLRTRFDSIRVLPMHRLLSGCPLPAGLSSLDSDGFFMRYEQACPDIAAEIRQADWIVINGEGSIHGTSPVALFLLYLAYVAKRRHGKRVAIVNHSCYPGNGPMPDGTTPAEAYYRQVYGVVDRAVVREGVSLANVAPHAPGAQRGFDCLPLFLAAHGGPAGSPRQKKLVLGGSVAWSQEMVNAFAGLAGALCREGFAIEILSGAKALLAADETGFVESMVKALETAGIPHTLRFPLGEREWLEAIGTAALVVSGRFHYSIAAAFQRVPFLVAESNTPKIDGLLSELGLEATAVGLPRGDYPAIIEKARRLLLDETAGMARPERLDELLARARLNFASL